MDGFPSTFNDCTVSRQIAPRECKLCFCCYESDNEYVLDQCGCSFCKECMKQYVEVKIDQGQVLFITCPDGSCSVTETLSNYEVSKLVSPEIYKRYRKIKLKKEVDLDPTRAWCPRPNCEFICLVPLTSRNIAGSQRICCVTCLKCGHQFCSRCKGQWHEGASCDEALQQEGHSQGVPFFSAPEAEIKRCPQCRVPIERDVGCAQMKCSNCMHIFCWFCLCPLDGDFLLIHYERGPCKDRLGHTRASLVCYRLQVVLIFLGLALLLIVAAPFLLLAAPCILGVKLKAWRRNALDPEQPPESQSPAAVAHVENVTERREGRRRKDLDKPADSAVKAGVANL